MPTTNHLKNETSAYLLQHIHNPVDWHPWNAETLALARELNKPILLSIGYSACHWCHVMAHESFEDEVTAKIMNNDFVNIKVDKEERPDLDKIYQTAHQLINNRPGGWPLTAVLDPKTLLPFFVGTYFPKEPRFGMMPFNDVLRQISVFYNQEKDQLASHQQQLREVLAQISADHPITQEDLNAQSLTVATQQLMQLYDKQNGGFGQQPKFPQPSNLERLLRYSFYDKTQQEQCLSMVNTTLTKMALGGIYDHLGGGFFRYSVDARWMIPHFEKMLYDNAQLLSLYSDVIAINKNPLYLQHINQTADWTIREMQAPHGGYYATLDADSEGEEGKFYVWHKQDVEAALNKEEYEILATTFALNRPPNFEGHWHLYVADSVSYPPQANSLLDTAGQKLFAIREKRIRPARDEKIITSWNGLMIKGMAKAGEATHNPDFIVSAVKSVDFIYANLWQDQRLLSTYQAEKARFNAYLDDYAYLLDGILYLLEAKWSNQHLEFAIQLAETLIKDFWDTENYGFFFTSHDHESLIYRPKPLTDEALPAGNGVAALALLRLGYLLGELRYIDIAKQTLLAAKPSVDHLPYAHNTLLHALEAYLHPPTMIIIRGSKDELAKWQKSCRQYYFPQQHVFAIPNDAAELPAALSEKKASAKTTAYICKGTECLMPLDDLGELEKWLKRG